MVFPPPGLIDKKNVVFYNRETLLPLIEYYLSHPYEAKEIGKAGSEEALAHHLPQDLIYKVLATVAAKMTNQPPPEFTQFLPAPKAVE
mmetsp:Transcript_11135/g.16815  ORF Transcript_11135/g.16815 Transcript_11135/m.16815 type:complete len:88 (+) Transcript_11135:546-809(+)